MLGVWNVGTLSIPTNGIAPVFSRTAHAGISTSARFPQKVFDDCITVGRSKLPVNGAISILAFQI